jgi:hypothetical protein
LQTEDTPLLTEWVFDKNAYAICENIAGHEQDKCCEIQIDEMSSHDFKLSFRLENRFICVIAEPMDEL